jgi:tRNA(Ile)-lysidine synthase
MHTFELKIKDYITRKALLGSDACVVVAVSGGADSVALLAVLKALDYRCIAAHCNFHLRGDESNRDMAHVQSICSKLDAELCIEHFDVAAQMQSTGQSVEMACRELRYNWFRALLAKRHAQAIAVGHHREDQVETFMLNLVRGTGIAGLTGMAPTAANVVRPLLECSRTEIEEYLYTRGISYIFDSTNAKNDYKRNRLRNIVIPELDRQFDGASNAILTTMSHLTDNKVLYDYAVQTIGAKYVDCSGAIDIAALHDELPDAVARMLLFEMLKPYNFNITHVENILSATATAIFTSATHHAELSRGILTTIINSDVDNLDERYIVSLDRDINTPIHIAVSRHNINEFKPERCNDVIYLDSSVLDGNPTFELRHWQQGDTLQPFGMKGSKLVSDIFADLKCTAAQKRSTWLLTRNGTVIWMVGLRASRHFTVAHHSYLRLAK